MFDRCNTIDIEDTRQAINQMGLFLQTSDQNSDQVPKNNKKGLAKKPANPYQY